MSDLKNPWKEKGLLKRKRTVAVISLIVVAIVFIALGFVIGRPLVAALRDRSSFREWMDKQGFFKYPLMVGIMALQIVIALIPGEPIEFAAGFIFGAWMGMFLCLLGCILGSVLIIMAVRRWGMKIVTLFVSEEQISNLKFLREPKTRDASIFFLFLLPGTPKDVLTYLAGLVPIHLGKYLLITTLARIPSVFTSTLAGSTAGNQRYKMTIIIYAVTAVLTLIGYLIYRNFQHRQKLEEEKAMAQEASLLEAASQGEDQAMDEGADEAMQAPLNQEPPGEGRAAGNPTDEGMSDVSAG